MFSAFKARRPWAAAAVTFIIGPFLGMLYLNRGYLALIYFGVQVAGVAAAVKMFPFQSGHFASGAVLFIFLPIQLVGAVHAYAVARTRAVAEPMHWYSRWYAVVLIFLACPAALLAVRTFLFQPFDTPSQSMSPTLNAGDYFLVEKFAYLGATPQRGDLVVFRTVQESRTVSFVKRIVGLPGDQIQLVGGRVYVNGVPAKITRTSELWSNCQFDQCTQVPELLETLPGGGQHRIVKLLSYGPLDNIPTVTVPPDSYYVLGDNRDNSIDSRGELGFVPGRNIVGRVAVKFRDGLQQRMVWQSLN